MADFDLSGRARQPFSWVNYDEQILSGSIVPGCCMAARARMVGPPVRVCASVRFSPQNVEMDGYWILAAIVP